MFVRYSLAPYRYIYSLLRALIIPRCQISSHFSTRVNQALLERQIDTRMLTVSENPE